MIISGSFGMEADQNGGVLSAFSEVDVNGTFEKQNKPAGQIILKGKSPDSFTAVVDNLDVSVLRLMEPIWPQAWGIVGGRGRAQVNLSLGKGGRMHYEGSWAMKDWVVKDRIGEHSESISASGIFSISWQDRFLHLLKCTVNLGKSEFADNNVEYSGSYDFTNPQEIKGEIRAESNGVELLPILRIIDAQPLSKKKSEGSVFVEMKLKARRLYWNGLEAMDFNASAHATANQTQFNQIRAGSLRWNGLEATDLNASVVFSKGVSDFSRIKMNLGGGPLSATYRQDRLSNPGWDHNLTVVGRGVELKPLLDLFVEGPHAPWVSSQRWGRIGGGIRLKWSQGPGMNWDWRSLSVRGLKGRAQSGILRVTNADIAIPKQDDAKLGIGGVFKRISSKFEPIFAKENKLNEAKLHSIKLQGRIEEGIVTVRIRTDTKYYKAETGGKAIMLTKQLGDTKLNNMPVQITLKPEIAKEFRSRILDNGKELPLPVFLWVNGKLNDLIIREDPVILAGLIAKILSNKPINAAVDILEETSGLIDKALPLNPLNIFFPREK